MRFLPLLLLASLLPLAADARLAPVDLPQAGARLLDLDHPGTALWREASREAGWRVADWDRFHAYPHRVLGGDVVLPGGPLQGGEDLDQRLRAYLAAHPDLLQGGRDGSLKDLRLAYAGLHGEVWYAHYGQTWRGKRVEQAELTFRVSPEGRILLAGSDVHPVIDAREPRLDRAAAAAAARALPLESAVRSLQVDDWVVLPILGEKGFRFAGAWPVRLELEDPEQIWRLFLDGQSGEILWSWNEVRHVEVQGRLLGLVEEQQPSDPDVPQPLQHLQLSFNGETVHTDGQGNYSWETSSAPPWTVSGTLYGRFADVQRQDGPDGSFSFQLSPGTDSLTVNLSHAQNVELDCYHHTTRVHDFITDMDPSFTWLDEPLPVRVNINQTCNAYWDGSSINFFQEGGGCPNTGRVAGVVYHEYGHGINDRQYRQAGANWGMTNGAMHEGLADVTAIYLQDESFVSPGWLIRNLDHGRRYPEDIVNQVHTDGLILGGSMYDLRVALGLELVRPLHHFARWGVPDDPDLGRASFEYFLELLVVDDDDGDLSNLTPHFDAINTAFNLHGVGSVLTWMVAEFSLGEPPVTWPPAQDLPLVATLDAPAFVSAQAVEVTYWSSGQEPQVITLTLQEDGSWTGSLPGQGWNTVLSYYARAVNAANVDLTSPAGAPDQVFRTRFVWNAGLVESFEEGPGGEALNEVWQWGSPPDGPQEAYHGDNCWGTAFGGDYPDMSLSRLVLDGQTVQDEDQVIVRLRHWMQVEEGWDGVNVEMSLNGDEDWQLVTPLSGYDFNTPDNNVLPFTPALTGATDGWESLAFDLTDLTQPGDQVRLRLNLFTDTAVTETGWYVDHVEYLGFQAPSAIEHEALGDSEDGAQTGFPVEARVNHDGGLTRFDLVWRVDGGVEQVLPMQAGDDSHVAVIPGPFWEQTVEYRLEAEGEGGFVAFLPANPAEWLSFRVGQDQTPPQVAFRRAPGDVAGWSAVWHVEVEASDNLAVPLEEVRLEWREPAGGWQTLTVLDGGDNGVYAARVDFHPAQPLDAVELRAVARDAGSNHWEAATEAHVVGLGSQQPVADFEDPLLRDWDVAGVFTAQQSRVHGGSWALGTSETGFYEPGSAGTALWLGSVDLREVEDPALVLWETWFLENGQDFAWIEVSGDGGEDWSVLAQRTNGRGWQESRFSLAPWAGVEELWLRFRFQADGDDDGLHIGWFADDVRVVNQSGVSVDEPNRVADFELGEPWPNPFNPVCRVELTTAAAGPFSLRLHNLAGQEVAVLHEGPLPAGRHVFQVDGSPLASGLYLLSARGPAGVQARRLLLVK